MENCNHEYKQWKGQIETCLFCHQIIKFQDMLNTISLDNGKVEYFATEVKIDPNNQYNYKLVK